MKPCVFCDTQVPCRDITGRTTTQAICLECAANLGDGELERVNVSMGSMQYILWCSARKEYNHLVYTHA